MSPDPRRALIQHMRLEASYLLAPDGQVSRQMKALGYDHKPWGLGDPPGRLLEWSAIPNKQVLDSLMPGERLVAQYLFDAVGLAFMALAARTLVYARDLIVDDLENEGFELALTAALDPCRDDDPSTPEITGASITFFGRNILGELALTSGHWPFDGDTKLRTVVSDSRPDDFLKFIRERTADIAQAALESEAADFIAGLPAMFSSDVQNKDIRP